MPASSPCDFVLRNGKPVRLLGVTCCVEEAQLVTSLRSALLSSAPDDLVLRIVSPRSALLSSAPDDLVLRIVSPTRAPLCLEDEGALLFAIETRGPLITGA